MKTKFKKTLGIITLSTGLIGMSLPMSGYAHRHHHHNRWHRHGGAVLAAAMVGMAVGAVAAGNSHYYNQSNCYDRSYYHHGYNYYNRWGDHIYRHGYWAHREVCY